MLAALRIVASVVSYRIRKLEMFNLAGAGSIAVALQLPILDIGMRTLFCFVLNALVSSVKRMRENLSAEVDAVRGDRLPADPRRGVRAAGTDRRRPRDPEVRRGEGLDRRRRGLADRGPCRRPIQATSGPVTGAPSGRVMTPPTDKAQVQNWAEEIRKIRYSQFVDQGISTQVGFYVAWVVVKVTGEGKRPTAQRFQEMKDEAIGHCDDSGVDLKIPAISF